MKKIVQWFTRVTLAVLFVSPLVARGPVHAQSPTPGIQQQQMGKMQVDEDHARAMMAEREAMMANMQAMDQKLNELVAQMNSATGAAKVGTIRTCRLVQSSLNGLPYSPRPVTE